jgi:hypothetical protein
MSKAMTALYGDGLSKQLMSDLRAENGLGNAEADHPEPLPPAGNAGRYQFYLRRKRQSAMIKQLLKDGGYGDLAKMVSIRKES